MEEMPNIIRSRLARKTSEDSAAHPDANLLAAFSERALQGRERAAVVAHLVECADCRECVALALAMAESEAPVVAQPGAGFRGWLREWRWIASAAAACCLLATALLYYGEPPELVSKSPSAVPVSSKAATLQMAGTLKPPSVPLELARKKKVEAPPSSKKEPPVLLAAEKEGAPEDISTESAPAAVKSVPQGQSTVTALAMRRLETAKTDAVSAFVQPEPSPAVSSQQALPANAARASLGPQTPAIRGSGLVAGAPLGVTRQKAALKSLAAESPRVLWSINASPDAAENARGVVERSTDAGQSWQVVPLSERASFRAVAAAGSDVWAGGSEGTLFHSSDGGAHWVQIQVVTENANLAGDIIRIDVRPNLVTIATTSGEEWTSADGGKHWNRE